ncbi:MAG: aminomethyl-transferring glycine dehydrogenase subunit GcvPA [Rhodospirillales bacterium]|nr:aminomethyl-transferring glycine dehydrogenase subunit GcvPA [Rhodospirillales bacterium]
MRWLPNTEADRRAMLDRIGVATVNDLFSDVPAEVLDPALDLPSAAGEIEIERTFRELGARNRAAGDGPFFLGSGAYRHYIPASVDALIQRGEFLTSYTPYQPEISQGTLQTLFEFQTQVALLTGCDVANASMYDGSTACAEATLMAARVTRRTRIAVAGGLHPHWHDTLATYFHFAGLELVSLPAAEPGCWLSDGPGALPDDCAAVLVQYPDVFGAVGDLRPWAEAAHAAGALLIVAVPEVVALGALRAPGADGADIVVAEGQSLGVGLAFGGPYVGLFATRDRYVRNMPGRLAGETVDMEGRRSFVLTLAAREQHIRRGRATSNICTNSGLCALAFSVHLALLGESGLARLARLNHEAAVRTADRVDAVNGATVTNRTFFNEFAVALDRPATDVAAAIEQQHGVLAGVPASRLYPDRDDLAHHLLIAATELTSDTDIERLGIALEETLQ